MTLRIKYFVLLFLISGCVDPYQFRISDQTNGVAVDAYLSNKSFNDSRAYPSEGRHFYVRLSRTSDVINTRSEKISQATVMLESSEGGAWSYTEAPEQPGEYRLLDDDFRAEENVQYRLSITTVNDQRITSDWQSLPPGAPEMGDISFRESTAPSIVLGNVVQKRGITPFINLPPNPTGTPLYYRWTYLPTWEFVAPLIPASSANFKCWATSNLYLPSFVLLRDDDGGYAKDLPFIQTDDNERILHEFSMLVEQQTMTAELFNFWREMQELNQTDGIFSQPPYNLKSNYTSSDDSPVFGYFGVVRAQARRWYFNRQDLSYSVNDWWPDVCNEPCIGCPPPACLNCLRYEFQTSITNQKPEWWGR